MIDKQQRKKKQMLEKTSAYTDILTCFTAGVNTCDSGDNPHLAYQGRSNVRVQFFTPDSRGFHCLGASNDLTKRLMGHHQKDPIDLRAALRYTGYRILRE